MIRLTNHDQPGYDAVRTACAIWRVPDGGYLRIGGDDRADFVQRQTTNDVKRAQTAHAPLTVLTNATARILDVWRLLVEQPDTDDAAFGVLTLPGRGATTARFLRSRIFFMDQVKLTDASADMVQVLVLGPDAPSILAACGLDGLPAPGTWQPAELAGQALRIIGEDGLIAHGYRLLLPAADASGTIDALTQRGAQPLTPAAYETWRVEQGLPGAGELTEDYTPLETGLRGAISDAKGCYTGQEIIARQITYDKITRGLVGVRCGAPVPLGADVTVAGRRVGTVTSAVESQQHGPLALAILKRPHFEPGVAVELTVEGEPGTSGETVALPL